MRGRVIVTGLGGATEHDVRPVRVDGDEIGRVAGIGFGEFGDTGIGDDEVLPAYGVDGRVVGGFTGTQAGAVDHYGSVGGGLVE